MSKKLSAKEKLNLAIEKDGYANHLVDKIIRKIGNSQKDSLRVDLCLLNSTLVVRKFCKQVVGYRKQIHVLNLLKDFKYTGKLLGTHEPSLCLIMEYCGESMAHTSQKHKRFFRPQIMDAHKTLTEEYGIYHNNMRLHNFCTLDKKFSLIDWEHASVHRKKGDHFKSFYKGWL